MALTSIGDIGTATFTATTTITWDTVTDWDNAVDENGVVHESVANTDHDDASIVKIGYSADAPFLNTNLLHYYPFDEDSGATAYDFGGTEDMSVNGPAINQSAVAGTSAYDYDGTDDYAEITNDDVADGDFTMAAWVKVASGAGGAITDIYDGSYPQVKLRIHDGQFGGTRTLGGVRVRIRDTNLNTIAADSSGTVDDNNWHLIVGVRDGDTGIVYIDGSQDGTDSDSALASNLVDSPRRVGIRPDGSEEFEGLIEELRFYSRVLSSSEIQTLYDVIGSESHLTTATKSLSAPGQPDLQNLNYTLNGETIILDVIGSPGTASEETVSQTLDGSTSYALSWTDTHTDFRVKIRLDTSSPAATPTVNRVELKG